MAATEYRQSPAIGDTILALEITCGILHAPRMLHTASDFAAFGVHHLAGIGAAGIARHIMETSRAYGGPHTTAKEIAGRIFDESPPTMNSRLSTKKFVAGFEWAAPERQRSMEELMVILVGRKTYGEDRG